MDIIIFAWYMSLISYNYVLAIIIIEIKLQVQTLVPYN